MRMSTNLISRTQVGFGPSTHKTLNSYNFCIQSLNKAYIGVFKYLSITNKKYLDFCKIIMILTLST